MISSIDNTRSVYVWVKPSAEAQKNIMYAHLYWHCHTAMYDIQRSVTKSYKTATQSGWLRTRIVKDGPLELQHFV